MRLYSHRKKDVDLSDRLYKYCVVHTCMQNIMTLREKNVEHYRIISHAETSYRI